MSAFAAWALSKNWEIPPELEQLATSPAALVERVGKWPWGNHETELLRALADAARRMWTNYDPNDPTTAPTNETVAQWLMEHRGVSERTAEVMAQILRPTEIRPGPRTENSAPTKRR